MPQLGPIFCIISVCGDSTLHRECTFGPPEPRWKLGTAFLSEDCPPPPQDSLYFPRLELSAPGPFHWMGCFLEPEFCAGPQVQPLVMGGMRAQAGSLPLVDTGVPVLAPGSCHLSLKASGAPADSVGLQRSHLFISCTWGFPFLSFKLNYVFNYFILCFSQHFHALRPGGVNGGGDAMRVGHNLLFRIFISRVTSKISLWFSFCFIFGRFWYQGYVLFIKLIRKFSSFLYPLEHFK